MRIEVIFEGDVVRSWTDDDGNWWRDVGFNSDSQRVETKNEKNLAVIGALSVLRACAEEVGG
jgi:hypothetical protein